MNKRVWIWRVLAAVIGFIACFGVSRFAFSRVEKAETEARKARVEYLAENEMVRLENQLNSYEQISRVWSGVVRAGNGEVNAFEDISQQLYDRDPTIRSIQLSPDGIVTYVYPKENTVIGYNVLEDDSRKEDAKEAIETGNVVISGPVELVQGGTGMILRNAIELDGEFWGFSAIVITTPDIFNDVGMTALADEGYVYALWKEDNGEKVRILGSGEVPEDAAAFSAVIGQREWTMEVAPAEGWVNPSTSRVRTITAICIGLLGAAAALLLAMMLQHYRMLEKVRSDLSFQTRALAASEKANRMQTKALEASNKANAMQAEALAASRQANQAQMEALDQARQENIRQAYALQESEAANRAKTEFISRISHDIRTPIGAIRNLTEFAKKDIDDKEKLKNDLDKIETSNEFLLSLINDVLDISRVDSGKIELNPEPYPYDEYAENIRNIMEPMCSEKGIQYEIEDRAKERGVIVADKIRINQIVLNILSNAVKYTPAGGKVKYISESEPANDGKVLYAFTVEDNGIGMSEEFQKKMFEEFSQEYNNPGREKGMTGTGLGLSIVKRMIDLMGGTISVKSEQGKGTAISVRIEFPDALKDPKYAAQMAKKTESEAQEIRFDGHVLVAEDNEINRAIAERILEECGLTMDIVTDGREAAEIFEQKPEGTYDAIFMDIQMPNMNGYEATEAIRAMGKADSRTVPIIAMTADAFDEAMRKAEAAGMTEYVTKPLKVDVMVQVMLKVGIPTKE